MIVLGLDLSLTGSGVALLDPALGVGKASVHRVGSRPGGRVPSPGHKGRKPDRGIFPVMQRAERIDDLAHRIFDVWQPRPLTLAVVEAPSFNSLHGHPHERSGLFWRVVCDLLDHGVPVVEVPPRSRAMYATGNGAADKKSVVAAMLEQHQLSFTDDNLVDAIVLALMGCRQLGRPADETLPHTDAAMGGVYWTTE